MTLVPAVLVLLVGSELIRNSVDRWFNAPMDDVLSSANSIAGDYYQERQTLVAARAARVSRGADWPWIARTRVGRRRAGRPRRRTAAQERVALVEVYRVSARRAGARG